MSKFITALMVAALVAPTATAGEEAATCPVTGKPIVHANAKEDVQYTSHHKTDEMSKDIVDTAASLDQFSTLVAAVKAADLVDALKGDGPFTVFAPTNEAFKKLPEGTVESLLKPENKEQLTSVLLYHVVPGKVLAKDVVNVETADTLLKKNDEAEQVDVKVKDGEVYIDKAKVVKTDVMTSNGVIHVIDAVLMP